MSLLGLLLAACTGKVDPAGSVGGGGGAGGPGSPPSAQPITVGPSGLHRLSRTEYDNTLADILGDTTRAGYGALPEDVHDPFDNDYATQVVSGALIGAAETLAASAAARALGDPARRDALVGCKPSGPNDRACLESFVRRWGRRALRRPVTDDEVAAYLGLATFSVEANDFYTGVGLVLTAALQDPSFLYRVERGTAVADRPGLYRLNDHEIGARLSYFLWGSTPPDDLLDLADAGALQSADGRRAAATKLLSDPRGQERVRGFHAFWLAYQQLPLAAALATPMRAESDALVNRVVFEKRGDYFDLFRSTETFVTDSLAMHYGLPAPGNPRGAWVSYGANPRRGILSHGAVLSAGAKFDDTSPTLRGVFVRNRLLCQTLAPPPPNVVVDKPPEPTGSRCKIDRYAVHGSGGCASCHNLTDRIGFGLENYDRAGAFRAADKDAPECAIAGDGEVTGLGKFNGPAALGDVLVNSGALEGCVVTQLYRMALGRQETAADAPTLGELTSAFKGSGRTFDKLLVDVVAAPAFIHRQTEP
ncbi:MAG: DUF1592 domain-containing protein [Pseudomonadota bacterium]